MKRLIGIRKLVILILILSFTYGCSGLEIPILIGAAGGGGTVAYLRGELTSVIDAPYDRVWDVSLSTLNELNLSILEKDWTSGKIKALRSDDKTIYVNLKRKGREITKIEIRVGLFGNQDYSTHILNLINKNLKE